MSSKIAKGASKKTIEGDNSATNYSLRKPSDYEIPVSPSSSTMSSPTCTEMKERRYVSAPKLPQSEYEAVDEDVFPSPLLHEKITEQYEMESKLDPGTGILNPQAMACHTGSEYVYIDENEINAPSKSNYEYIDEEDRTSLLIEKNVSQKCLQEPFLLRGEGKEGRGAGVCILLAKHASSSSSLLLYWRSYVYVCVI